VVLAAWNQSTGEQLWEIPFGTRWPHWGVWSDEVVLGFPDGQLVGVDATTCDSWSITVAGGIDDLAVTEVGAYITHVGAELAGFSGDGRGSWRYKAADTVFKYVTDNAGVSVFIDHFGDLIGLESSSGTTVFNWENSAGLAVHIAAGESFLYRAAAGELAARPIGGGGVLWNQPVEDLAGLWTVPGTLLAHDGDTLTAYEPATGEMRWNVPFDGEIAGPMVLDHNELHVAARHGLLTHDLWHLELATGSIVARGQAPDGKEWFVETDDGLMLEVGDDGVVRGITMLQRPRFEIITGANRVSRFTQVEVAGGGVIVTLSFSAERF